MCFGTGSVIYYYSTETLITEKEDQCIPNIVCVFNKCTCTFDTPKILTCVKPADITLTHLCQNNIHEGHLALQCH